MRRSPATSPYCPCSASRPFNPVRPSWRFSIRGKAGLDLMMGVCVPSPHECTAWAVRGYPPVNIRIGLSTGTALVGNLGSRERLSYTCVGDVVDAANKMEELNKEFGTYIAVTRSVYVKVRTSPNSYGERTENAYGRLTGTRPSSRVTSHPPRSCSAYSQAQSKFLFRPLDKLHSKRRQREPEVVYELIGARERYGDHDGGARPGGTQFTDKPVWRVSHPHAGCLRTWSKWCACTHRPFICSSGICWRRRVPSKHAPAWIFEGTSGRTKTCTNSARSCRSGTCVHARLSIFRASSVGANDTASARLMEAIETQIAIATLTPSTAK